jgi:hypothetical protein
MDQCWISTSRVQHGVSLNSRHVLRRRRRRATADHERGHRSLIACACVSHFCYLIPAGCDSVFFVLMRLAEYEIISSDRMMPIFDQSFRVG